MSEGQDMLTKEDHAPKVHWWQEAEYDDVRWKTWAVILGIVLALSLALAGFGVSAEVADAIGCRNTARTMELPYRWSISTSCMVDPGTGYVPLDNYRVSKTAP